MNQTILNARPLGTGRLNVKKLEKVDGEIKEVQVAYDLVIDFNAFKLAREKTGLDFADPKSWENLPDEHLLTLCWCSLRRFHPEITVEELGNLLPVSVVRSAELWNLILELCFPGAGERIAAAAEELKQQSAAGEQPGEAQPAAEIATPSIQNQ